MGTVAPCSGRFAALTKSPLTGIMVASSCGGPFGMAFKTAGWDGLLITGKSSQPTYLDKMKPAYYRIRGYDENGIPLESLKEKLKIT